MLDTEKGGKDHPVGQEVGELLAIFFKQYSQVVFLGLGRGTLTTVVDEDHVVGLACSKSEVGTGLDGFERVVRSEQGAKSDACLGDDAGHGFSS